MKIHICDVDINPKTLKYFCIDLMETKGFYSILNHHKCKLALFASFGMPMLRVLGHYKMFTLSVTLDLRR